MIPVTNYARDHKPLVKHLIRSSLPTLFDTLYTSLPSQVPSLPPSPNPHSAALSSLIFDNPLIRNLYDLLASMLAKQLEMTAKFS
jgi:hypothetical protein